MRTLARGLDVLDFIARRNGVSFTDIQTATGLSKAVVHRIVVELVRYGFAWKGQADRKYYAAPRIAATPTSSYAMLLRSASSGPMQALIEEVSWPSDLFACEGPHMVMIDSNRSLSPFHLRWSCIGRRVPMLLSSVGRATLSRLSEEERNAIYDELQDSGEWHNQVAFLKRPIEDIVKKAREMGYAEREFGYAGPALERHGETSIAVAIEVRGIVLGALNIWWPVSADSGGHFTEQYYRPLACCVGRIRANLMKAEDLSDGLNEFATDSRKRSVARTCHHLRADIETPRIDQWPLNAVCQVCSRSTQAAFVADGIETTAQSFKFSRSVVPPYFVFERPRRCNSGTTSSTKSRMLFMAWKPRPRMKPPLAPVS